MFKTLSGRFLILTIVFVMLAEVLIFVPSIARFRLDYLNARIERAQIASLALLADDMLSPELEQELLNTAQVYNVVLVRDAARQLMLSSDLPQPVAKTFDLRDPSPWELIRDTIVRLMRPDFEIIRLVGLPFQQAGDLIEVTMETQNMRTAMIDYGQRILLLSLVISIITAAMLFFAVRILIVVPIKGVATSMGRYASAPQDIRRIITPTSNVTEIRDAEYALQRLQGELTSALKQKQRLATLGEAVAKISHDLRNILASVQLLSDRIEESHDPMVQRIAPRLIRSVARAVSLTENTLAFGRVNEPSPRLEWIQIADLIHDVIELERLGAGGDDQLSFVVQHNGISLRADPEQLHRVLQNLVKNARQAIQSVGHGGQITIGVAQDDNAWRITVSDTGPGLPPKAREKLFQAFSSGGTRSDGTGLGLAIAQELIVAHGGQITLHKSDDAGTEFQITLPKKLDEIGKL